jgi:peptidoglycan/LPS O-acetylase OafA/YrhL
MGRRSSIALDQWRGLAMVLVLVSHGFYFSDRVHGIGRIGIQLFFFVSGVLVYCSLARRRDRRRSLLAVDFWWRRLRRLYPALLAYVALMLPVTLLLEGLSPPAYELGPGRYVRTIPSVLVYATDYWPTDPPKSLGHLWSVACEMQFFLVAPLIFFLGNRIVWVALLVGLMAAGVLAPVVDPAGVDKYHFEYAAWPLMLGFCCEHGRQRLARLPERLTRVAFGASLVLSFIGVALPLAGRELKTLAVASGTFVVVACLLAYVRGLEIAGVHGRALSWLGRRTYSIYLWQQPLTICTYLPAAAHPLGAALSTLVGAASFHFFERPFLTAGRRRAIDEGPG